MGSTTRIGYADATWEPVAGCTPVSPGCDHCWARAYAEGRGKRLYPNTIPGMRGFGTIRLHFDKLDEPLDWLKPRRILVCSRSDLFHPSVSWPFIGKVFSIIWTCQHHTFMLLTKRPGRMAHYATHKEVQWRLSQKERIPWSSFLPPIPMWPPNAWAGTSVESAKYLPRLDVLARVPGPRWVSLEPLLGPVNLRPWLADPHHHGCLAWDIPGHDHPGILDWVVVGGESGPNHRPMQIEWLEDIVAQCQEAEVPVWVKQGSARWPGRQDNIPDRLWQIKEVP